MKKTMITFMVVVCLVLCSGKHIARAQEFFSCPYCKEHVTLRTEAMLISSWGGTRIFKDGLGAEIHCYEYYTIHRIYKICDVKCGVVQTYEVTNVTHTANNCPYNK